MENIQDVVIQGIQEAQEWLDFAVKDLEVNCSQNNGGHTCHISFNDGQNGYAVMLQSEGGDDNLSLWRYRVRSLIAQIAALAMHPAQAYILEAIYCYQEVNQDDLLQALLTLRAAEVQLRTPDLSMAGALRVVLGDKLTEALKA